VRAQGYSVVDNKDGTYKVTFGANVKANTKVPFDASLTHRVVVGVRSVAVPGVVGKTPGAYAGPLIRIRVRSSRSSPTRRCQPDRRLQAVDVGSGHHPGGQRGNPTFARDIVTVDACNQCHFKIQYGFPRGNNTSGHFGSRTDTKTCVVCHTPQNEYDSAAKASNGEGDFTPFIHAIHMGEELSKTRTRWASR